MDGWRWPAFLNRRIGCALALPLLVLGACRGTLPSSGTQVANERPNGIPNRRVLLRLSADRVALRHLGAPCVWRGLRSQSDGAEAVGRQICGLE